MAFLVCEPASGWRAAKPPSLIICFISSLEGFSFQAIFSLHFCCLLGGIMAKHSRFQGRFVSSEAFRDLRKSADLTRKQASDVLDVAVRTVRIGKRVVLGFRGWRFVCCAS